MTFYFIRECAGDIGMAVTDKQGNERVIALCFFRAAGGYPVFDVFKGGEPKICNTLPEALNYMIQMAQKETK